MEKIKATMLSGAISSNSKSAFSLYNKSSFGERIQDKIQYSLLETLYLIEKNKMEIYSKNKKIEPQEFLKKIKQSDKKIQTKYLVFKDLREKGHVVKTALKFGAEFRVYEKSKPTIKAISRLQNPPGWRLPESCCRSSMSQRNG